MLSNRIKQDIAELTHQRNLSDACCLIYFYTHLFPNIPLKQILHLQQINGSGCNKSLLHKALIELRHKRLLTFSFESEYTSAHVVPTETLKRWAKSSFLEKSTQAVKKWAIGTLQNQPLKAPFAPGLMLRLLKLNDETLLVWQLINKIYTGPHSLYRFTTDNNGSVSVFHQIRFYEMLSNERITAPEQLPEPMRRTFLPAIYRNTSLHHLPQYLDEAALRSYHPQCHDETDNISDVCLHIALQSGQWSVFEPISKLSGVRRPTRYTDQRIEPEKTTINPAELAKILSSWRQGKWAALKKIKSLIPALGLNSAIPPATEDIPLLAMVAPLIFLMRFAVPKTSADYLAIARDILLNFHETEVSGFIRNCLSAYKLTPSTYHNMEWDTSTPLNLMPKALCLASFESMPDIAPEEYTAMCQACTTLHNNGLTLYSWYMANALLCLPGISPDATAELELILHSRTDLPLLFEIRKKASVFDTLLDNMQDILLLKTSPTKKQEQGFISWRLSFKPSKNSVDYIYIYAHKKLKTGKFSSGKQISGDELLSPKYENYLSEQDNAIIQYLQKIDKSIHWMLYYELSPALAKLLCGHPHIMLRRNNKDTPIELEPSPPELTIKKQNNLLNISLQKFDPYIGVPIRHICDNRYAIFCEDAQAKQLRELIYTASPKGSTLQIPEQHTDRLLTILFGFSDSISLKGNITTNKTQKLKTQPKVIAFLKPGKGVLNGHLLLELYPGTPPVPYFSTGKMLYTHQKGKTAAIARDAQKEQELRRQVEQLCPTLCEVMDENAQWSAELSDAMLHLVEELQHCPADILETRWQEGTKLCIDTLCDFSAFNISAQNNSHHWLQIGGEVQVNEEMVLQLTDLLRNINQSSGQYIELTEAHFLKLSKNIEEQLRALSALAPVPPKDKRAAKTVEVSPALLLMLAQAHGTQALPLALQQQAHELLQQHDATFYKPRNINASLREYQTKGYYWMQRLMSCGLGACLADDMGLGKTLQILCVLLAHAAAGPSLVVAPASVCNNWSTEAAKFTPTLNIYQLETDNREELVKKLGKRDVLVCSYGLLVTASELLTQVTWNIVVLDEAQYIKNSQTRRARTACKLQAKCRIAATGTPIENSLDELWSIFDFINHGYLGSQEQFRTRFGNSPARRKLLRRIIAPFVLRRLKSDVLDEIPEKTETTRNVILSPQERALYETCRRDALAQAQQSEDRFTILAQLMRLRRICCHPKLVDNNWAANAGKMEALVEMADELRASGHKALIFSQFTDMLALVRARFDQEGYSYLYLDGSTPKAKRGKLVDAFQDGEADFFLISLKAGGTGLNLTAADYVILLDPWWNPAVESQAADRTHRIGQKRPVTVCRFVCQDTIEERVMELHAEKRELFDQVINNTAKAAPLSLRELRELM